MDLDKLLALRKLQLKLKLSDEVCKSSFQQNVLFMISVTYIVIRNPRTLPSAQVFLVCVRHKTFIMSCNMDHAAQKIKIDH